jgi:hypothetical protein
MLERGINTPREVRGPDKISRRPAILITSSPHKKGSKETPWQDHFETDIGHIRYFGDNKHPGKSPEQAPGNKALKQAFFSAHHHSRIIREKTPPLLFFKRVPHQGKMKGFPQFHGFGVVKSIELVTQWDNNRQRSFTNYAFDFTVLSLAPENEQFNWQWISDRRNPDLTLEQTQKYAPETWKLWLKQGSNGLDRLRRRVSKLLVAPSHVQRPIEGTEASLALETIYNFFAQKRHHFEALAEIVTARVVGKSGEVYEKGWLTSASSDGGADFVGRVNLGSKFSQTKLVLLGQAKCEKPSIPTGGNHIARTVARLRRGWIGAYVTTSYFSPQVQQEVVEDRYPIILIPGKRVAEEVLEIIYETDEFSSITEFLESVSSSYDARVRNRDPEEILTLETQNFDSS